MSEIWVAVRGPARVERYDEEKEEETLITDSAVLAELDGQSADVEDAPLASFLEDPTLKSRGVSGGGLTLFFDEARGLEVETRYALAEKLADDELLALTDFTVAQWEDAIGESETMMGAGAPVEADPSAIGPPSEHETVLSLWEHGDTYRVTGSWFSGERRARSLLVREPNGAESFTLQFLED